MHPGGLDTVTCGIQTPLVLLKAGVMCHGITQRNGMVTAPGENPGAERSKAWKTASCCSPKSRRPSPK